ncbi:P-loop containing nucleoside triphosphate hydrolase protein [Colletotrichum zoysiae]|uniref:P-loop containing nucleoside triphosphate hydrolase protein n=1 Tax=Colletotrichum zoysiae TaxID=1216348 RepID=A0AAD9HHY6_9PEZI|nr:P-loop containing nucleoside triphosphate hydrolase protein [Colletotrichum zoysiae]
MEDKEKAKEALGGDSGSQGKTLLRVDQFYSRKDRQWRYVKTAKVTTEAAKFSKYSIVVRRVISSKGLVADKRVDVKSPKLAELLRELLKGLGDLELSKSPPELSPQQLYYAWPGLEERLSEEKEKPDRADDFIKDLTTALEFLNADFANTKSNMQSLLEFGDITYDLLWALFTPRAVVYTEKNTLKEQQAYLFFSGEYHETPMGEKWYQIQGKMLHHDNDTLGWGFPIFKIPHFTGTKRITSLDSFPLKYHPDKKTIREILIERGRKYVEIVSQAVCLEYNGLAVRQETNVDGKPMEIKFSSTGRIMVDPATFYNQRPNESMITEPWIYADWKVSGNSLNDEEVMLSNHRVQGFGFTPKTWGAFAVSRTQPVIWNMKAFDKLIMNEKKKTMIRLLIQSHRTNETAFDDIVVGKGRGLVGLLSGPPGVGKTLTAEVVAELSWRPLYVISAGELGTTVDKVDRQLGVVLDITRRWGCVLLIDEADVFLFKRGEAQLERNALVSVFLRRLEYFQGIVILTTNRRKDIDIAFKSRIHFRFHYPALSEADRLRIWQEMLGNVTAVVDNLQFSDADLKSLAEIPMNGREIKNAVSSAASIVRANKDSLTVEVIKDMLRSLVDDIDPDDED